MCIRDRLPAVYRRKNKYIAFQHYSYIAHNMKVFAHTTDGGVNMQKKTEILCSVNNCVYHKDNHCVAETISVTSVSYTHLDVYKRQLFILVLILPETACILDIIHPF